MLFWEKLYNNLVYGKKIAILYVLHSYGSSPGRQGFKLFATNDGDLYGSIGGGFMEHKLVELAKSTLKNNINLPPPFIKKQLHQSNIKKDKSGMICSGEQTVAFYFLDTVDSINNFKIGIDKGKVLKLTENGIEFLNTQISTRYSYKQDNLQKWTYLEQIRFQEKVYVIGGGHVGLALSQTMKQLGFYVIVFDNRENLNTMIDNKYADEKHIVNYEEIANYISEGDMSYVVLVSFGFRTDELCMSKLLKKKFKYFGVMGSKEKMKKLLLNLKKNGFFYSDFDNLHTPIGVPINSKTPEEIAISIAAEIIKIKNS